MRISRPILSFVVRFLSPRVVLVLLVPALAGAQELSIGVPYLPAKIDPFNESDPVNRMICATVLPSALRSSGLNVSSEQRGKRYRLSLPAARDASAASETAPDFAAIADWLSEAKIERAELLRQQADATASVLAHPPTGKFLDAMRDVHVERSLATPLPGGPREVRESLVVEFSQFENSHLEELKRFPFVDTELAALFGARFGTGTLVAGTGMYVISQTAADQLELIAAKPKNLPEQSFVKIKFRRYVSAHAAAAALRSGEIDLLMLPTNGLTASLSRDPTLEVKSIGHSASAAPSATCWRDAAVVGDCPRADAIDSTKMIWRRTLAADARFLSTLDLGLLRRNL